MLKCFLPTFKRTFVLIDFAREVKKVIKKEIGDKLFSVLIDESRDISIAEQMAVIVRLVTI